jgi:hypothetical protein
LNQAKFYLQLGTSPGVATQANAKTNYFGWTTEVRYFLDEVLHKNNELIKVIEAPTWLEARNEVPFEYTIGK